MPDSDEEKDNSSELAPYPSPIQRQVVWTGLTAFFVVVLGAIGVGAIFLVSYILGYLQPILVPVAVAAILAYLLEPIVVWVTGRGIERRQAVYAVFSAFMLTAVLLAVLVIRPAVTQWGKFSNEYLTELTETELEEYLDTLGVEDETLNPVTAVEGAVSIEEIGTSAPEGAMDDDLTSDIQEAAPETNVVEAMDTRFGILTRVRLNQFDQWLQERLGGLPLAQEFRNEDDSWDVGLIMSWMWEQISGFSGDVSGFFSRGIFGAAAVIGYLLGLLLVPIYLFFFLRESQTISKTWSAYVPLRKSRLKDEVVGTLQEVNGYLIAYFRGQMVVSLIDGILVAIALTIIDLPYALLLGVFLAILGLIPFIGNIMVLIPAMLIATVHFADPGNRWDWLDQVWVYPLIVLGIFVVLQQINGLVTAPKIVGDSVGLHPLTVIFSILFWTLLLGGLLGALLAVPLTASVKVLFRRYIWEARIQSNLDDGSEPPPDAELEVESSPA